MSKRGWVLAYALAAVGLWGCGATVGDSCTVGGDCGDDALCLNGERATPGGYCSRECRLDDDGCPGGSTCVAEGAGSDVAACFRRCDSDDDCREGYACRAVRGSATVCVGRDFDD